MFQRHPVGLASAINAVVFYLSSIFGSMLSGKPASLRLPRRIFAGMNNAEIGAVMALRRWNRLASPSRQPTLQGKETLTRTIGKQI